jgi:YbgC/YbaW family acyl-CoA thioester hydrolase
MHMLLRTLWVFLFRNNLNPSGFNEKTTYSMRVLPVDLDILMHVNNGMYFSFMDFGRWNMIFRNGVYNLSKKKGWYSVVAGETIKFKKSLKLWDKFSIETQVVGHDEKYFFINQKIVKDGEVMSYGLVKVRFLKYKGGTVSTQDVMSEFKDSIQSAPILSGEWLEFEARYLV